MYHNPHKIRIPQKSTVWNYIENGELVILSMDAETSGFPATDVPYSTLGSPFITEHGDHLELLGGTHINSAQIFMNNPEWSVRQAPAEILQRVGGQIPEFDSEERHNHWIGMAMIAWRIEQAAHAVRDPSLGLPRENVKYNYYNKQFKPKDDQTTKDYFKERTEEVLYFPMINEDGEICYDARYHLDTHQVARRVDRDSNSPYYWNTDNLYMQDPDGSIWIPVDAKAGLEGFNFLNYDLPVYRTNFYRAGFSSRDTTLFTSRAKITNRLRPRMNLRDVRDMMYWGAMLGKRSEDAVILGDLTDPRTGKIRHSEALTEYARAMTGHTNNLRLFSAGPLSSDKAEFLDLVQAHGAMADAAFTAAIRNHHMDVNPHLFSDYSRQRDKKKIYKSLTAVNPDRDTRPLYLLPRRQGGTSHSVTPYWFLGTDSQGGNLGKQVYLLADGNFHKSGAHNWSTDQWVDYLSQDSTQSNPDRLVRLVTANKSQGFFPFDRIGSTPMAAEWRKNFGDIGRDCNYITAHTQMLENITAAVERTQMEQQLESPYPMVTRYEDDLMAQYHGEVNFQEEARELEARRYRNTHPGARSVEGPLHTLHAGMNNVYQNYFREIDDKLGDLFKKAHIVDAYRTLDPDDMLHEHDEFAARVFDNFVDLANRTYATFKSKKWDYKQFLDEMTIPGTDEKPYFEKGKFQARSLREIAEFRRLLGQKYFNDFNAEMGNKRSDYIQGNITKFTAMKRPGRPFRLLFMDADNGLRNGNQPCVIDAGGRQLPIDYLKDIDHKDLLKKLGKNKEGDNWHYQFRRIPSDPSLMVMMQRFVTMGWEEDIPPNLIKIYVCDKIERLKGFASETIDTDRMATLRGCLREVQKLQMSVSARSGNTLERDPNPMLGQAAKVMQFEEAPRLLQQITEGYLAVLKKIEKLKKTTAVEAGGHDSRTGLPFDYIPYVISRDPSKPVDDDPGFIVQDIPVWHMRNPIRSTDLSIGHCALIAPDKLTRNEKDLINGTKINRGNFVPRKTLIAREPETGVMNALGPVSVETAPSLDHPRYSDMMQSAANAYEAAGKPLSVKKKLLMIHAEDVYPIAGTRPLERGIQTLKVPSQQFWGMTAPKFVNMSDIPVTTHLVNAAYIAQKLERGKTIRLREMEGNSLAHLTGEFGHETGHIYDAQIDGAIGVDENGLVSGLSLQEIIAKMRSGDIPELITQGTGLLGPDDLEAKLAVIGLEKFKENALQERFALVTITPGESDDLRRNWAYVNNLAPPKAAFSANGGFVPHDVYQDLQWYPANDL